jgi:preprotein translocase subunit YajC
MEQALLPLLLIAVLAIPLILGSRRQKKMVAQQQELQSSLTIGDKVMTTSGLYGTVSDISDEATIGIEIAPGVETTWLRQAVREKIGPDVVDEDEVEIDETPESSAQVAAPIESDKRN